MRKVGVIGIGHVGVTVAFSLFTSGGADQLVLIDTKKEKATAEVNDFKDALARNHHHLVVVDGDYSELADADVIVTAFGDVAATVASGDRFGEFNFNTVQAQSVGAQIKASGFHGIIVDISNPCDVVTNILQQTSGLPRNHVFGTGTSLDTARMQRAVAAYLGDQDPRNIGGYVLGEHGNSQFTAWSTVTVGTRPLAEFIDDPSVYPQMEEAARQGGFVTAAGKGYTNYAVATCAVRLVEAVFSDARLLTPVSTYVEKVSTYVGYPAFVGADGVVKVHDLELTADENAQLEKTATYLKENAAKVGF